MISRNVLRRGLFLEFLVLCLLPWAVVSAAVAGQPHLTDAQGKPVSLRPPQRIVSLVPAVTEILYAIGAGDQVAGHTYHNVFPAEGGEKIVGGFFSPSIKAIEAKQPGLIILTDLHGAVRDHFSGNVELLRLAPATVADLQGNIMALGRLTGREEAAAR